MRWPKVGLGDIAQIVGGSTPRRDNPEFWGPGYYWATPTDLPMPGEGILNLDATSQTITEEGLRSCSTSLIPVGGILYSTRATIGKLAIANVSVATNQGFNNFIVSDVIFNRFLAYSLQYFTPEISLLAGSTTFKEVSRSSLRGFKIPLPPLREQHRIVEILDEADRLRRLRREADAKAVRILPALFLKMFGDPAMNPRGWDITTIGNVVRAIDYGTSTRASDDGFGVPLIRMGNVDYNGHLDLRDLKHVQLLDSEIARFRLQEGDILFNRTNSKELVGKTGLWDANIDAVAASYFIRVRVDHEQVTPTFFWAYMNCSYMKKVFLATARGAIGQANINSSELRGMVIYKPPLDRQHLFTNRWKQIRATIPQRTGDKTDLDCLFSTLLQRAFSGQLTAKWREAHSKELLAEMEQQARLLNLPLPLTF